MQNCTQVIDISDIGFDISELGRVKVGTLIVDETSYEIYKGENVIGRDELSDIVLRNNSISSKHAVVEVEDWDSHFIFDCGSTNKTRMGNIFLKPHVRYNLQDGEELVFANLKAKYVKLKKPETAQTDEDNVSDAGSESLLNTAPIDEENVGNPEDKDDLLPAEVENNNADDESKLNDSSFIEENKQKPTLSKLQVVDASDDSTDDEVDFVPPSQTVKEFALKKFKSKIQNVKDSNIVKLSTDNALLNTQDQEMIFMSEKQSNNINTCQNWFSSEVQEPLGPKVDIYDQSIFEAETQENDASSEKCEQVETRNRESTDIFDADTEVPCEDLVMSNLELSTSSTVSNESVQKSKLMDQYQIRNEDNLIKKLEKCDNSTNPPSVKGSEQEGKCITEMLPKLPQNSLEPILELVPLKNFIKEETKASNLSERVNQIESSTGADGNPETDSIDLVDLMTQPNPYLSKVRRLSSSSYDSESEDISNVYTEVNTSLKIEPLMDIVVKKEISFKVEPEEVLNFTANETQLNLNLHERNETNKNQQICRTSDTSLVDQMPEYEGDETQPNLLLHNLFSESGIKKERNAEMSLTENPNQQKEKIHPEDSDSTDIEDDQEKIQQNMRGDSATTIPKCVPSKDNSIAVNPPATNNSNRESKNELEIDENSRESDSILASDPVVAELLGQGSPPMEADHLEKENEKNESHCDNMIKKDVTVGDMDICSTVGNGTYTSACGSLRKAENSSKFVHNLPNSSSKPITQSRNLFPEPKEADVETNNHSIMFNEPCGSSTPLRTEERVTNKDCRNPEPTGVKTPSKVNNEQIVFSPDLPCTDELIEVACKTPEVLAESSELKKDLPLALKRTPRARKLSRKVVEALEETLQVGIMSLEKRRTNHCVREDSVNSNENIVKKKKVVKRKSDSGNQQKDSPDADVDKTSDGLNEKLLKQNECVKSLTVNLTDINICKTKDTNGESEDDISPSKKAKKIKENRDKSPIEKEQPVIKKRLSDKKKNLDTLEISGKKSARDSPSKLKNETRSEHNINKDESDIGTFSPKRNNIASSSGVDNGESSSNEKILPEDVLTENSNASKQEDKSAIEDKSTSVDEQQCNSTIKETRFQARSFTSPKNEKSIEVNTSNSARPPRKRKTRAESKSSLPRDVPIKDLEETKLANTENLVNVDQNVSNKDDVPLKRTKFIKSSSKSRIQKCKVDKNADELNQKSRKATEGSKTPEPQDTSDLKNNNSNQADTSHVKIDRRATRRVQKDGVEVSTSEISGKCPTLLEENVRRSNRRKKEDVSYSSKTEVFDERKTLEKAMPVNVEGKKKKSVTNLMEKNDVKTQKSNRKNKEQSVSLPTKETSDSDTRCNKSSTDITANTRNNFKRRARSVNESVIPETPNTNNDTNEDLSSSKSSDKPEKSTKHKNPPRSRVKPARYREKDDGSDSSCTESNKEPASTKRKGRHEAEPMSSTMCVTSTKKHSEDFKTPVVEKRSRSRSEINNSRSCSRSDSSRSSLKSDISTNQSPRRHGAKSKRVLFTSGLINPTWESQVKKLGGSVVDCPVECSLLVADKVRRTVKFLCVLGQGKPIVSPEWLIQSWRCTSFIDPMDNLLCDGEAEEKFRFRLSETMKAAEARPLLTGYHVHATPSVKPPPADITSITECCGGKYLEKVPSKWPENTIIISHVDDKSLWKKFKVKNVTPPIVAAEMLLIGVLQHRLDVESHRIS